MDNNDLIQGRTVSSSVIDSSWFTNVVMMVGDATVSTPNGTNAKVKKDPKMPVKIFFELMKKKMGILKDISYKKRIKKIEEHVDYLSKNGQIAFSEELMKKLFVLMREAEMYANGKRVFLTRDIFDRFSKKTARPVLLTPLKNYARPIPDAVLKEKQKCDDAKLFDGYVVMHYDSKNTVKETEQDKKERRERDPILFGLVEESNKLYFVEDWEDEYCDLTLDDIVDKLGLEDDEVTMSKEISL